MGPVMIKIEFGKNKSITIASTHGADTFIENLREVVYKYQDQDEAVIAHHIFKMLSDTNALLDGSCLLSTDVFTGWDICAVINMKLQIITLYENNSTISYWAGTYTKFLQDHEKESTSECCADLNML